jgi:hypothetical protein
MSKYRDCSVLKTLHGGIALRIVTGGLAVSIAPIAEIHLHRKIMVVRPNPAVRKAKNKSDGHGRVWFWLIICGVLARVMISVASLGSNDAAGWRTFGDEIRHLGLLGTYRHDIDFNHPPLPGYWAAAASILAGRDDFFADSVFTTVFKLPAILADGLGIYLLWRIWRPRLGNAKAMFVAALFACSLDAILVSAYHCNTDSILVALCLLAVYLMENRGWHFWGGFALGAAINVKIIPVLLLPCLVLSYRSWSELFKVLAGLALWVLPFVPVILAIQSRFVINVLQYNSVLDRWGLNVLMLGSKSVLDPSTPSGRLAIYYYFHARYLIWAAILIWAFAARVLQRWDRYEIAAVTFCIFLLLTPGFGVQYTVLPGLLLFACLPRLAFGYSVTAGIFLALFYWTFWTGSWPAFSAYQNLFPPQVAALGIFTWILLLIATIVILVRPRQAISAGQSHLGQ